MPATMNAALLLALVPTFAAFALAWWVVLPGRDRSGSPIEVSVRGRHVTVRRWPLVFVIIMLGWAITGALWGLNGGGLSRGGIVLFSLTTAAMTTAAFYMNRKHQSGIDEAVNRLMQTDPDKWDAASLDLLWSFLGPWPPGAIAFYLLSGIGFLVLAVDSGELWLYLIGIGFTSLGGSLAVAWVRRSRRLKKARANV